MRGLKYVWVLLGVSAALTSAALLGANTPAEATSCTAGSSYKDFTGTLDSKDTITVWTKDNLKLCSDVSINITSYTIDNPNYNGQQFKNNPTAIPQSKFATKTVIMKKGTNGKTTLTVDVPNECTPYQIDAYIGKPQTVIDTSEGLKGTNAIVYRLFDKTKDDCSVPKVTACNTTTGVIGPVDKANANKSPYTTDLSKCEVPACNTTTGVISSVNKADANKAPYTTNTDKCTSVTVCVKETGEKKSVTKDEAKDTTKYGGVNDAACNPTPTPETPVTVTPETPKTIASTGPAEIISGVVGAGSVAGATTLYVRSRRNLFK